MYSSDILRTFALSSVIIPIVFCPSTDCVLVTRSRENEIVEQNLEWPCTDGSAIQWVRHPTSCDKYYICHFGQPLAMPECPYGQIWGIKAKNCVPEHSRWDDCNATDYQVQNNRTDRDNVHSDTVKGADHKLHSPVVTSAPDSFPVSVTTGVKTAYDLATKVWFTSTPASVTEKLTTTRKTAVNATVKISTTTVATMRTQKRPPPRVNRLPQNDFGKNRLVPKTTTTTASISTARYTNATSTSRPTLKSPPYGEVGIPQNNYRKTILVPKTTAAVIVTTVPVTRKAQTRPAHKATRMKSPAEHTSTVTIIATSASTPVTVRTQEAPSRPVTRFPQNNFSARAPDTTSTATTPTTIVNTTAASTKRRTRKTIPPKIPVRPSQNNSTAKNRPPTTNVSDITTTSAAVATTPVPSTANPLRTQKAPAQTVVIRIPQNDFGKPDAPPSISSVRKLPDKNDKDRSPTVTSPFRPNPLLKYYTFVGKTKKTSKKTKKPLKKIIHTKPTHSPRFQTRWRSAKQPVTTTATITMKTTPIPKRRRPNSKKPQRETTTTSTTPTFSKARIVVSQHDDDARVTKSHRTMYVPRRTTRLTTIRPSVRGISRPSPWTRPTQRPRNQRTRPPFYRIRPTQRLRPTHRTWPTQQRTFPRRSRPPTHRTRPTRPTYGVRPTQTPRRPTYRVRPTQTTRRPTYRVRPTQTTRRPTYRVRPTQTTRRPAYRVRPTQTTRSRTPQETRHTQRRLRPTQRTRPIQRTRTQTPRPTQRTRADKTRLTQWPVPTKETEPTHRTKPNQRTRTHTPRPTQRTRAQKARPTQWTTPTQKTRKTQRTKQTQHTWPPHRTKPTPRPRSNQERTEQRPESQRKPTAPRTPAPPTRTTTFAPPPQPRQPPQKQLTTMVPATPPTVTETRPTPTSPSPARTTAATRRRGPVTLPVMPQHEVKQRNQGRTFGLVTPSPSEWAVRPMHQRLPEFHPCRTRPGQLVVHPRQCHWYYNCTRAALENLGGRLSVLEEECRYPQLFDTVTGRCREFINVDCQGRFEPVDPCEYQGLQCRRSANCVPCNNRFGNCRGRANGIYPFHTNRWTPTFVTCYMQRNIAQDDCQPPTPIFSPEAKDCVALFDVPKPRGGLRPDCGLKEDGFYPDEQGRCGIFFECRDGEFGGYDECPSGTVFDPMTLRCQLLHRATPPCGEGQNPSCSDRQDGFHADPFGRCPYYFECRKRQFVRHLTCDYGSFDPVSQECVIPTELIAQPCGLLPNPCEGKSSGFFPYNDNAAIRNDDAAKRLKNKSDGESGCRRYVECSRGVMVSSGTCPDGTVFSAISGRCDRPENAPEPCGIAPSCEGKEDGKFSALTRGCSFYFECKQKRFAGLKQCSIGDGGFFFNERTGRCDFPQNICPPCGYRWWGCPISFNR